MPTAAELLVREYRESPLFAEWAPVTATPDLAHQPGEVIQAFLDNPSRWLEKLAARTGAPVGEADRRWRELAVLHHLLGACVLEAVLFPTDSLDPLRQVVRRGRATVHYSGRLNETTVEDAVSELVERLFGNPLAALTTRAGAFSPHAFLSDEAYNAFRRVVRAEPHQPTSDALAELRAADSAPQVAIHEMVALLQRELGDQWAILERHVVRGESVADIAKEMGIGLSTAYRQLQDARRRAAGIARRQGFE